MSYLDTAVDKLNGVGAVRAQKLAKLGIFTVYDLVYCLPRAYECRGNVKTLSNAELQAPVSLLLTVGTSVKTAKIRNGLTISKFKAFDESGSVEVVFFNAPYVKEVFSIGAEFRFYGKLSFSKKTLQLQNPKYESYLENKPLADIIPVYPETRGLSSKIISGLMSSVIDSAASSLIDPLPEKIRIKNSMPSLSFALRNTHFPSSDKALSDSLRRLAFDEMLIFGLSISYANHYKLGADGIPFKKVSLKPICDILPYELTDDQKNAVNDIYRDTVRTNSSGRVSPMARILVGDVGSGKTICAVMAIYLCVKSGYQAALMVPTAILANQHYSDVCELLSSLGIRVRLLTGNTTKKEKNTIYEELKSGECDLIIGTHALISDKVEFLNLGLIVTDEQHRFGVLQRSVLKEKASKAHLLVMSATPIPRTLALAMYGDLDISKISQTPKGRVKVDTFVVNEAYRNRINDFIKKQVALGGQCYIVCPSIDPGSRNEELYERESLSSPLKKNIQPLKNAIEYTELLKQCLPDLKISCLHGKMKSAEKDLIMTSFANGDIDVLVSTTVIEVGINVPNATLMVVENAEKFGLSALHQLRGRVGRGAKKSYCILVSDVDSEKARARLDTMRSTCDGYEIAERDLALRGPGDFFTLNSNVNLRQSGGFEFKFAGLCDDISLFNLAFSTAKEITSEDSELNSEENLELKRMLSVAINSSLSTIS